MSKAFRDCRLQIVKSNLLMTKALAYVHATCVTGPCEGYIRVVVNSAQNP